MATMLRPLSTSELLDRTFFLYRKHFVLFVGIAAIPQIAVLAVQLGGATLGLRGSIEATLLGTMIGLIVNVFALTTSHAATVMAVSDVHLEKSASIGAAFGAIKGRMLGIIGIMIGVGLGVGLGLVLLIVPGIYLALAWSLAIPVTVLEGTGLNDTLTRSTTLTKGDRLRIFVVYVLLVLLEWVVMLIVQFPLLLLVGLLGLHDPVQVQGWTTIFTSIGTFVSTSLVAPLLTIGLTLIYYDERVRKEGFDLQLMMAALQAQAPSASMATP
jgi:Membrane domain of glycerophosphoryl diester phosphodiesterase